MHSDREATSRWLSDIRHHIAVAQSFVAGMSHDAFRDDLRTTCAVIRCFEIISQASRRLPDALTARHPSIAWKNIVMRLDQLARAARDLLIILNTITDRKLGLGSLAATHGRTRRQRKGG
jgi:uncharacterized protein with HEPN domain